MDESKKRQLYRLNIAKWDMDKAVEFFSAALTDKPPSLTFEALVVSGIIHYARPFSTNEKEKIPPADARVPEEVIDGLSSNELELHNSIITRRNKAIAHAEWAYYPVGVDQDTGVMTSGRYSVYPEFMNIRPALDLATKIRERLHFMVADHLIKRPNP